MASRKENLKALFANTRTRVIIIFTFIILVVAIFIGVIKFYIFTEHGPEAATRLASTPSISSIPGSLNPTEQYAELQEKQNVDQAQAALVRGGSAIPTIIKTQTLSGNVESIGAETGATTGEGGVGFVTLSREPEAGVRRAWFDALKKNNCSADSIKQVISQGGKLSDVKTVCSCAQLKKSGYQVADLKQICSCKELKSAGVQANEFKQNGYTPAQLEACGFDACTLKSIGFTAQELKDGGFNDDELKGAGFSPEEIARAGGIPPGMTTDEIRKSGCNEESLRKLKAAGVSAAAIRRISGCNVAQLKAAGFTPKELKNAGFTAAELKGAGFTPADLKAAGFGAKDLLNAGFNPEDLKKAGFTPADLGAASFVSGQIIPPGLRIDCSEASLKAARAAGISATTIRQKYGCDAAAMKAAGYTPSELKDAEFTPAELKNAGFNPRDLRDAGFGLNDLKNAGFSPKDLKDAGFDLNDLKNAGFNPKELQEAGYTPQELKNAGFKAIDFKNAGLSPEDARKAGFNNQDLRDAGWTNADLAATPETTAGFPSFQAGLGTNLMPGVPGSTIPSPALTNTQRAAIAAEAASASQLQKILKNQNARLNEQRFQQNIQQRSGEMASAAGEALQSWARVATQIYVGGAEKGALPEGASVIPGAHGPGGPPQPGLMEGEESRAIIKTGDILFAVIDTTVNSDEPSPILATVVSGRFKGAKLIGSFTLPNRAKKVVISFNTMSVPGAPKSTSINAFAIDANTARTALSSRVNNHYLLRYGSLFASSFLEGFGNALMATDTIVTVGGTGGGGTVTIQQGIGRSTLTNAVIGLATLGRSWGQAAQQLFNTPPTIEVCSGTAIGVLFTQDLMNL
jgi:intracellular multiplication protein IcmE